MLTETRVVLLTDMKGFTAATSRQTREENARMLALHDALLLPVIRAFRGRRVKSLGDSHLVLFDAPTEALLCAMAIQDRLWDYDRRVAESERIEVRVALALGEVRLVRSGGADDVFGEAVNLASRIEAEAESGEIWFSESVWWVMDRALVPWEDMGSRRLKGLAEAARLFRVARGGGPELAPYGGTGLSFVRGLPPPDPVALARRAAATPAPMRRRRPPVLRTVAVAVLLGGAGAGAAWLLRPGPEALIDAGRLDEAAAAIAARAALRGPGEARVLYLTGRLELARADRGHGGDLDGGFRALSRAVAAGSGAAVETLRLEGRAPACERRRRAARALVDARSPEALPALREIAAAEPARPPAATPLARFARALASPGRCGDGDLAREGIDALEAAPAGRAATR
jgi:class 3 adenylate cyclase